MPTPSRWGQALARWSKNGIIEEITASCVSSCRPGVLVSAPKTDTGSHSSPDRPAPWGSLDAPVELPRRACCSKRCSTFYPPAGRPTALAVFWANALGVLLVARVRHVADRSG